MGVKRQRSAWFFAGWIALVFFGALYSSVLGWLLLIFAVYALRKYFKGGK